MSNALQISELNHDLIRDPERAFVPQEMDNTDLRTIKEVEGAIIAAKRFPRNEDFALNRIRVACSRSRLAESAIYQYPRGGTTVDGPSIRLAETLALCWGNIQKGVRELSSDEEKTKYEAYAYDIETNVRASRVFTVRHGRYTRSGGFKKVDDPRDIYEVVASHAARRLRACILEIIPQDIVEEALEFCEQTLEKIYAKEPIEGRRDKMFAFFKDKYRIPQEVVAKRFQKNPGALNVHDLLELKKIARSLEDGMSRASDWFEMKADGSAAKQDLNKAIENIG